MIFVKGYFYFYLAALLFQPALAGSGFYYGFDAVSHALDTSTEVRLTFTPPPPNPVVQSDQRSQSFSDVGFHLGYLFKHRRTQNYFMAPEFFVTTLDSNDTIYGTNFKFGTDIGNLRVFANLGVNRVEAFRQNKLQLGLGAEYAINDHQAISVEWLRVDTIKEDTTADSVFGSQTLTTDTHTERVIEVIKISFRIYLLE
ncbi:MAG: hypothetical protein V3R76_00875 [Gammaproteobacteria bacterium]